MEYRTSGENPHLLWRNGPNHIPGRCARNHHNPIRRSLHNGLPIKLYRGLLMDCCPTRFVLLKCLNIIRSSLIESCFSSWRRHTHDLCRIHLRASCELRPPCASCLRAPIPRGCTQLCERFAPDRKPFYYYYAIQHNASADTCTPWRISRR